MDCRSVAEVSIVERKIVVWSRGLLCWCLVCSAVAYGQADLVVKNAKIVTVDEQFTIAEAMAVADGRVVAVGQNVDVESQIGGETKVVDLNGKMVLPGLIDSHVHPSGASLFEADHEIPPMDTIADVQAYIRQRVQVVPKGEWIQLSQVFITRLREQRFPTRAELDEVAPGHPVLFRTGPDGSLNTLGLDENGIDRNFAKEHPDQVLVDQSGEPNGLVRQLALMVKTRDNIGAKPLTKADRDARLLALFHDYNRVGITAVIDRNCNDASRLQYERLLKSDELSVRVAMSRSLDPKHNLSTIVERLDSLAADPFFKTPDPRLSVIGVKVFEDGGMLTGSAYFRLPWGVSSIYGIEDPGYRGMQYVDGRRLTELMVLCAERGLAFTAHCQGDAAVEALVEAYQRADQMVPIAPTRSTLTHSSFMTEKVIAGAAKLGIGIDLQPAWLYLDARTLMAQFGHERLKYFLPLRSLFEANVVAGGGSDHMQKIGSLRSVNPYNPFLGMWIAVSRRARWYEGTIHAEQALSREQMVRFYTINNAWLMRAEKEIGSLESGKRADFIVIDRDLLNCPLDDVRHTKVISTWLDGQILHDVRAR